MVVVEAEIIIIQRMRGVHQILQTSRTLTMIIIGFPPKLLEIIIGN